ncbi:hypothetical protein HAALTHF_34960n [Vreelandella aquamarina]|nr:hypothetical protein HAALTHF_34960n [Halomonas axialensis]
MDGAVAAAIGFTNVAKFNHSVCLNGGPKTECEGGKRGAGEQKRPPLRVAINAGHTLLAALHPAKGQVDARNLGTNRRHYICGESLKSGEWVVN